MSRDKEARRKKAELCSLPSEHFFLLADEVVGQKTPQDAQFIFGQALRKEKFVRNEHDSLGTVSVPQDAAYGSQTARAISNFPISGHQSHPALIRAYLRIKIAAAKANEKSGVLDHRLSDLIIRAAKTILDSPENWAAHFPVDIYQAGAGTSQNMNINEVIANIANQTTGSAFGTYNPIHPNDHVNCSQSTNDTYPSAMRLALLDLSGGLLVTIQQLANAFAKKATDFDDIPKAARTHLQDAVPIRLGQEFSAYARTMQRCAEWLKAARNELKSLGLGGSAVGTKLNVPAEFPAFAIEELRTLTGEHLILSSNFFEAMQSQSPVVFYSSMLRLLAIELTRICNDLRLLASGPANGFYELILPAAQPGSSIMPGKINPSLLEMMNQVCFAVLGFDHTVVLAAQAGQLELNVMMPVMAAASLEATTIMTNGIVSLTKKCIIGIEANTSRLRQYFQNSPQLATALSPKLGYAKTSELVKEALATNKSVLQLAHERKLISADELQELTDFRHLT